MTNINTTSTRRRSGRAKAPLALRIPLTVLATMPEKLRILAETLKVAAAACGSSSEDFRKAHDPVRNAFDEANSTANCAVNSFGELAYLINTTPLQEAKNAAKIARALTSAIYKAAGNIHNNDAFKGMFSDVATLDATVAALHDCGDQVRTAVRPFGY